MGDGSEVKRYYNTRVQIPVERVTNEPDTYNVYCLPKDGVSALLLLIQYAKRRITYVAEHLDSNTFLTATDVVFLGIQKTIEKLEVSLLSPCTDISDSINAINVTLEALNVCVCAMQATMDTGSYDTLGNAALEYAPDIAESIVVSGTPLPGLDADLCDLANVCWGFQKQWITEQVLPFLDGVVDATTIAIGATSGFAVLSGGLGLPVAMATSLLSVVVNMLIDSSVENLINWMISNAQEMVCHLYNGFVQGGYQTAALLAKQHIDASGLPLGDRMMLNLSMSQVFYLQSMQKTIDDALIDPADYDDYGCEPCSEYDYTFFYDGYLCPVEGLRGSHCTKTVPQVDVSNTAWTDNPPLIVNTPGGSIYHLYINTKNADLIGGTFNVALKRGDNDVTVELQELVIPSTGPRVTYHFEFSSYPLTGTYVHLSAVGASAAVFYWIGVVIE